MAIKGSQLEVNGLQAFSITSMRGLASLNASKTLRPNGAAAAGTKKICSITPLVFGLLLLLCVCKRVCVREGGEREGEREREREQPRSRCSPPADGAEDDDDEEVGEGLATASAAHRTGADITSGVG